MKPLAPIALALFLLALPLAAPAQRGGHPGGGAPRGAAPAARPAAPVRPPAPAPAARPAAPGGFDLHRDIAPPPQRAAAPVQQRPAAPPPQRATAPTQQRPAAAPPRSAQRPAAGRTPPLNRSGNGPFQGHFQRPLPNPHHWNGNWSWNHNVAWQPAPIYWGGGFWGPLALDALAGAVLIGSIDDEQAQLTYPSYQVEPDTPGALLLQNYGLQQTPCGPPDLVVIWGPDNSLVCAYPNQLVGPGNYEVDPTTLTLVSQ